MSLFSLFNFSNKKQSVDKDKLDMDTVYHIDWFGEISKSLNNEIYDSDFKKGCLLILYCNGCLVDLIKRYDLKNNLHGISLAFDNKNGFVMRGINYEGRYAYGDLFGKGKDRLSGGKRKYILNGDEINPPVVITNELLASLDKINGFLNDNKELLNSGFIKDIPSRIYPLDETGLDIYEVFKFIRLRDYQNNIESITVDHPFFVPNTSQAYYYQQIDFLDVILEKMVLLNGVNLENVESSHKRLKV